MYHILYDQFGTMFEVTSKSANILLRQGWTLSFPEDLSGVFNDETVRLNEQLTIHEITKEDSRAD